MKKKKSSKAIIVVILILLACCGYKYTVDGISSSDIKPTSTKVWKEEYTTTPKPTIEKRNVSTVTPIIEVIATETVRSTATVKPTATEIMVYVSNTGKYHSNCKCSGMTEYTTMTLKEAEERGYVKCKRCY